MKDFVELAGTRYPVVQAELHTPLTDGQRFIHLFAYIESPEGPGGFGFNQVEVPLLAGADGLDGQRIHVRPDGYAYEDDTLATDYVGAEVFTDLNFWRIGGRDYLWGEMQIDFERIQGLRYRVRVRARLAPLEPDEDMDENRQLERCTMEARAEFTVVADERDAAGDAEPNDPSENNQ